MSPGAPNRRVYVELGDDAPTTRTWPLAMLTVGSFVAVTLLDLYQSFLVRRRTHLWQRAIDTRQLDDAHAAADVDAQMKQLTTASWGVLLVAVLSVAWWSLSVARNARTRGVPDVKPAKILWIWFLPLFGPPIAIKELCRFVTAFDYSDHRLRYWLYATYANFVIVIILEVALMRTTVGVTSSREAISALDQQSYLRIALTVVLVYTCALAVRAIVHADRAISRTRVARPHASAITSH